MHVHRQPCVEPPAPQTCHQSGETQAGASLGVLRELEVGKALKGSVCIPLLVWCGESNSKACLVMERMHCSVMDYVKGNPKNKYSRKRVHDCRVHAERPGAPARSRIPPL